MKIRKRKINGILEPIFDNLGKKDKYETYISKIKEGEEIICEYNSVYETRTIDMNSRLWKLYSLPCPDHFNTPREAHKYFGEKYLIENTLFNPDETDFNDVLQDILINGRKEFNAILKTNKFHQDGKLHSIEILWVRSTASLKIRKSKDGTLTFGEFMELVENELAKLGFILEDL